MAAAQVTATAACHGRGGGGPKGQHLEQALACVVQKNELVDCMHGDMFQPEQQQQQPAKEKHRVGGLQRQMCSDGVIMLPHKRPKSVFA